MIRSGSLNAAGGIRTEDPVAVGRFIEQPAEERERHRKFNGTMPATGFRSAAWLKAGDKIIGQSALPARAPRRTATSDGSARCMAGEVGETGHMERSQHPRKEGCRALAVRLPPALPPAPFVNSSVGSWH